MIERSRTIVTGSTGFIGSHLIRALTAKASSVTAIARGDDVERRLAEADPEFIFHLAASQERGNDAVTAQRSVDANIMMLLRLLTAASKLQHLKTIVILGTAEEYGANEPPFQESMREAPVSIYSFTKACATHLAQMMNRTHGVPCVVLRPSIVFGPGQRGGMLIPSLIASLAAGTPFAMTRGEQTRDFIYVSDVVDAIIRAAKCTSGEVLNVGSGVPVPIRDVAHKIAALMQRPDLIRIGALEYRATEMMNYYVDNTLARTTLSWAPRVSLDEGLAKTVHHSRTT